MSAEVKEGCSIAKMVIVAVSKHCETNQSELHFMMDGHLFFIVCGDLRNEQSDLGVGVIILPYTQKLLSAVPKCSCAAAAFRPKGGGTTKSLAVAL